MSSYFVPFKYTKNCTLCLFFNSTVKLRLTFSCFAVLVNLLRWTTSPQGWLLFHPPFLSEYHLCNSSVRLNSHSSFAAWYIPTPRGWLLVLAYICYVFYRHLHVPSALWTVLAQKSKWTMGRFVSPYSIFHLSHLWISVSAINYMSRPGFSNRYFRNRIDNT